MKIGKISIPTNCPSCDSVLVRIENQLFCKNTSCEAKDSKRLMHFTKTMKIMGLGEKTLEKLEINSISELYSLDQFTIVKILGEKIGTKIYNEIEKSKNTTLGRFLSSLSIPLIGKVAAEKIQRVVSSIEEINEDTCKKAGLGPKAIDNLINWKLNEYTGGLPFKFGETTSDNCFARTVCISGKTPGYTKAQIKELLADFNVGVVDNVTKDIDYLISEEQSSAKVDKAKQYNINIITLNKLMEIIENE